jgi:hypothetical protein
VWRVLRWSGRKPDCECGQSANGEHYKHEEELHKVELERLVSIVNQRPLATKTIYKPRNSADVHEAGTSWDIRMPRNGHAQKIRIITFAPDEAQQLKQPYPKPVVELGCRIQKVRKDITGEEKYFGEECQQELEIH